MTSVATTSAPMNAHVSHSLHGEERTWPETIEHADLWIELLHARRLEPRAVLGFTLGLDFEGDQFTCLRVPPADLRLLYGINVHELRVWRSLSSQVAEQCARGRVSFVEVDAFFLPDTALSAYRYVHRKTTIAVLAIDVDRSELRYLHRRRQHTVGGNDFAGVFRLGPYVADATTLPPFVEIAKLDGVRNLGVTALVERAAALTRVYLATAPAKNPIARYAQCLAGDLDALRAGERGPVADYARATVCQAGACFGLTASLLGWLHAVGGDRELGDAAAAFERLAICAKAAHLKIARLPRTMLDASIAVDVNDMASAWDEGMTRLADRFAR